MEKQNVIKMIQNTLEEKNNGLVDAYVSQRELHIAEIKDSFQNSLFEQDKDVFGWLVFVDLCNIANWSHPCEYWFVSDNGIVKQDGKWMPSEDIKLMKIKL